MKNKRPARHVERDCLRIVTMHFIWLAHRNTRRSIRLMRQPQATSRVSTQEYLRRERASDFKSEYLDGKIYPLSGSLRPGAKLLRDACAMLCLIEGNVIGDLHRQLKVRPETVFGSELRLKVAATGFETTPDASVYGTPIEYDGEQCNTALNPKLIAEVLSPSTEADDRGKKFNHYRCIPSLRGYLLVSIDEAHVERYLRNDGGSWTLSEASGVEANLHLPSLDVDLSLSEVYAKVDFSQAADELPSAAAM